jgi:hypothetical protein
MNSRWMNIIVVLTVALISLVTISSAAGLLARPDLYTGGQCGAELSVPAPGILKNDIKSTGPIQVKNPEKITLTDPKFGTVKVGADGSFVFTAAANLPASGYAYFYYRVTDGTSVSSQALVKITVYCKCRGAAPEINVCPGTVITPAFLMSKGAGCMGCRDATPKFDLSRIPAQPVAGQCYPYTVSCPACQLVTGHVCFRGCDDGNACTTDSCNPAGGCTIEQVVCDDGNACTTDSCNPATGCTTEPVVCNDGNACTTDSCNPATGCTTEPAVCNDGNACTTDSCNPATGCTTEPVVCNDGNACTTDSCNPATGCTTEPVVCNDGNACTTDSCNPATGCTTEPVVCNDGDACTTDSCNPATGCTTEPVVCNDGNACTTDACVDGVCVYTPIVCDDGNPCTIDYCDTNGCVHIPVNCDDQDACTTDSCVDGVCVHTPIVCNDGNACTTDACVDGVCVYTSIVCNDGNACTTDSCNPATGCTTEDVVCDDGNVCTADSCNPDTGGCVYTSVSCDFVSPPVAFPLPAENCPDIMPADKEIIALAGLECTCLDSTPVIIVPPHEIDEGDPDPNIRTWEYTALCGSPECGTYVTGEFASNCELPPPDCDCAPTAPDLCSCKGFDFPMDQFEELGGGCYPAQDCDVTPMMEIDDSGVDYNTPGKTYPYTVTCLGCENSPVTATGEIDIFYPTCAPTGCVCNCCL